MHLLNLLSETTPASGAITERLNKCKNPARWSRTLLFCPEHVNNYIEVRFGISLSPVFL